jgi:hypothetical protein
LNKDYIKVFYEISDNDDTKRVEFQIKKMIPVSSMISVVQEVVSLLFSDGEYNPALRDCLYWKALLSRYTDIDMSISYDDLLEIIYNSNLEGVFYQNVSMQQIGAIDEAIQEAVNARNNKSELDLLMHDIRYFIKRYEKVFDKVLTQKNIKTFMNSITEKFGNSDFAGLLSQLFAKEDVKM